MLYIQKPIVYSPHVSYADEAVCVGAPPSSESYLNVEKIIETCKNLEVDAIHPGYGFLSENADFARRLVKENITLIGPSAEAMEMMGDKLKAKATVKPLMCLWCLALMKRLQM